MIKILNKIFNNSLFKASLIYSIADSINKAIPFFLLPVLTHYLSPSDYGISTNYNIYISILLVIIGLSVQGAISSNYFSLNKKELGIYISNVFLIILGATATGTLLVLMFQNPIVQFLNTPFSYMYLGILVAFAQAITSINLTLWQLEEKPINFGVYQISQTILNVVLSLLFIIILNLNWKGRVDAQIYSSLIYGLFSIIFLYKRGYLIFNFSKNYIKDILVFCIPLLPHALSMWIRSGIDRVFITKYIGEAETGIYATGFQFGLLISFLTMAFNQAYTPFLYKKLNISNFEDLNIEKVKLVRITYLYIPFILILSIIFTLISFFIVDNFLSDNYLNTKKYIPWAIFSQSLQGMYYMFGLYVFFVKKTKGLAIITFLCALIHALLSYFLIQKIGAIGAAYTSVIVSFLNFIAVALYSNKVYDMPWNILKNRK